MNSFLQIQPEKKFSYQCFAKCILAGEHSVLRGGSALVLPVLGRALKLEYESLDSPLQVQFTGDVLQIETPEIQWLFWAALETALQKVGHTRQELNGVLKIKNNIPVGAGLGASAALCVAITKWLKYLGWIDEIDIYEFARQIENLFHGESSGVDIASALYQKPLLFRRSEKVQLLDFKFFPKLYLSYSGFRGVTSECVQKVKTFIDRHPQKSGEIDQQMSAAVEMILKSFEKNDVSSVSTLAQAMSQAKSCFEHWGLCGLELQSHMQELLKQGALAVKPTGSGGGGYVLSLWSEDSPPELKQAMISVF